MAETVETLETLATEASESVMPNVFKFKTMMIGSMSSGKSDMMARYFNKNPHDLFLELTNGGMT